MTIHRKRQQQESSIQKFFGSLTKRWNQEMNAFQAKRRQFERKQLLNQRLAQQREEQLAQANSLALRLNQSVSIAQAEPDSPPIQRNVPAQRRTQENFAPVARQAENNLAPSIVNVNASQAVNPHSPLTVSQVSWSTSPASSRVRAKRPADDSSDDESIDIVKEFLARENSAKHSSSPAKASKTADHADGDSSDSESVQKRKSPNNSIPTSTAEPARTKKPIRNPLTMSKISHAIQQDFQPKLANDDDLWSDTDDDKEPPNVAKQEKTKKPSKRSKKSKRNENPERELDYNRPSVDTLDHLTEDEVANVDSSALKPVFDFPKFTAEPEEPLVLNAGNLGFESPICVPASISRYLPPYQKEGIQFMYDQAVNSGHGAVLGDDMGLGKTVQVIALLSALLQKKGDGRDLIELIRRKNIAKKNLTDIRNLTNDALDHGYMPAMKSAQDHLLQRNTLPKWAPILIIAPNSVLQNWVNDFETWGHFSVVEYRGENKEGALEKIRLGSAEIMLMGKSVVTSKDSFPDILETKGNVQWKLIIVDEFHQFKNHTSNMSINLRELRNAHTRNIIGLTGTLMQNEHSELWNLVDIVYENFLGLRKEFSKQFGRPIKYGMAKNSTPSARKFSEEKQLELSNKMPTIYKRRLKEHILKDLLPMKDERVVFCEPSDLQVEIYKYLIDLPDFDYLRKANLPCGCGVNKRFFVEYKRLTTRDEKIAFQRQNKDEIIPRKKCHFVSPSIEDLPKAVIWRQNHEGKEPCERCPYCIILPALTILNKLSSHVSLLQVEVPPHQIDKHREPKRWKTANELMQQAKIFLPDHILHKLPGGLRVQKNGLMNEHCKLSGKMTVLQKLLKAIESQGRVLLFSSSTQMLNLIEDFIKSEGHSYLRMDGSTDTKSRSEIVDKFKNGNDFIFLLSTKAMGLGLNLTEASFVIIYDIEWNPSWDSQAQDRAYRIGQQKNVKVFRLVTRGTIEELKYLRQVYKTHLTNATIPDIPSEPGSARMFDGVAKDKFRQGELFGIANLLKFHPGTFMNYAAISETKETKKYGELRDKIHSVDALKSTLMDRSEEAEEVLFLEEEDMFPNIAMKKDDNSDEGGSDQEGIIGGESQLMLDMSNEMGDIDHESDEEPDDEEEHDREKAKDDDSSVQVFVPVADFRVVHCIESTTPDHGKGVSDTESGPSICKRKRKQWASNVDMTSSGNYSLVGRSAHNLLHKDTLRTSFRMSDFALPNNKGRSPKK